mgnify:CR=1 FL=1
MLLSVVIPAYNASQTIERAIDSVYQQGLSELSFEITVVNDGSSDDTSQVIFEYIKSNGVKNLYLIEKENGGVASARNQGILLSKGKYIAFLDSDDAWLENKLDRQISFLERQADVMLVASKYNNTSVSTCKFKEREARCYEIDFSSLTLKNYFQPSTVIIRRSIINDVGIFREGATHAEEGLFFYNIAYKHTCILIDECYLDFGSGKQMFGESGLSGNLVAMEKGELFNYLDIYKRGMISTLRFCFLYAFSIVKFFRRYFISTFLRLIKS